MERLDAEPRGWEEGPSLLQSAWRYNWILAFAALLGALLGYGWASRQPVLYQATSKLLFGPTSATLPGQAAQPSGDPERYLNNQAQLIGSMEVLGRAARRSGVKGASADSLAEQMTVEVEQDADVITITVLDPTPRAAASLANAVGAAYQAYVIDQPSRTAEELRSVNNRLQNRLGEINAALAAGPPRSEAATLQLEREAITKQQGVNAEQIAAITATGGSNPVQLQEEAAVPGQPAQPAVRRTAAIGALFGLVVGVALAWLLSTRRTAGASVEWLAPSELLQEHAAGGGLVADADAASPRPMEAGTADQEPAAVPTGNGMRPESAAAPLVRRLAQEPGTSPAAADHAAEHQPPEVVGDGLIDLLDRLEAAIAGEPLHLYAEFLPQTMADELTSDGFADLVAVLLENGVGSFEVVGAVGLPADEQHAAIDRRYDLLLQARQDGVSVVQDTSQLDAAAADIPGVQNAQALTLVPLVQDKSWIGMLLVGRRSSNGQRATAFNDQEVEDLVRYAADCTPVLHSLLLLRQLQQSLAALDPSRA